MTIELSENALVHPDADSAADGANLIFVAGAPGSKWSAIAHAIMYAEGVDISDVATGNSLTDRGVHHVGNYFGPGMEFGSGFDNLADLSKPELLRELSRPYDEPLGMGRKLLKSHMFARHLPLLKDYFPAARFVLVHRDDEACLSWWQQAGGFAISFPDYSWYEDTEGMRQQITIDNDSIKRFAAHERVRLVRRRTMSPVLTELGLQYTPESVTTFANLPVEKALGLGDAAPDEIIAECHAMARLASVAVI